MILKKKIDKSWERCWFAAEAERHKNAFEGSELCIEGSLFDILGVNSNRSLRRRPPSVIELDWNGGKWYGYRTVRVFKAL